MAVKIPFLRFLEESHEPIHARIHPTAVIDPLANLANDVVVGPYVVIDGPVTIGAGSVVGAHAYIQGPTVIGRGCRIGASACIGVDPQHVSFVSDPANPTYLVIGDEVVMRECCRLSRATKPGEENATRVGDKCYIMGAAHIGHDCVLETSVMLADSALLGGHVHLGERAFIGGGSTIHQFVHIGRLAIIAGNEAFTHDVPPFAAVRYGRLKAYNAIGCRRAGMRAVSIRAIRACYQRIKQHRTTAAALEAIRTEVADLPEVQEIISFIQTSRRGILPSHSDRGNHPAEESPTSEFSDRDGDPTPLNGRPMRMA